jgi:hypothetical protein
MMHVVPNRWLGLVTTMTFGGAAWCVLLGSTLTAQTPKPVTYSKDVAPIFREKCEQCHHPNTAAPMSLQTFAEVRPWAKDIKTRVANREMPPWHLDKTLGIRDYKDDISLSDDQIDTVLSWIDQGALEGNPASLPPAREFPANQDTWLLVGQPDLVAETDEFTMYAKGSDWWIYQYADTGLTEDRYIKAIEIKPTNAKVVHHAVTSIALDPGAPGSNGGGVGGTLTEYAIGKYGDVFPDGTGKLLKAGSRIRFDMHYFAIGTEEHNRTKIAFKFYPKGYVPKYAVRSINFRDNPFGDLEIPPNSIVRNDGYYHLTQPTRLDAFQPHMHMRGKQMILEAIMPDNSVRVLTSVDHFDFAWMVNYIYADDAAPLLPAGTILHIIAIHDNTSANRRNPDPSMWVGFGERSVDDMTQAWVDLVTLDQSEFDRLVAERKAKAAQSTSQQQQ